MKELKKMIKKSFDFWVRMRWLKMIDKEIEKRDKLWSKYSRQKYVASELFKRYCELYPDALGKERGNDR